MKRLTTIGKLAVVIVCLAPIILYFINPKIYPDNISKIVLFTILEIFAGLIISLVIIYRNEILRKISNQVMKFVLVWLLGFTLLLIGFIFFFTNFISNTNTGERVLLPIQCNARLCVLMEIAKREGQEIGVRLGKDRLTDIINETSHNEVVVSEIIYDLFFTALLIDLIFLITMFALFFKETFADNSFKKLRELSFTSNFEVYIETYSKKKENANYVNVKFHIFISYSSPQKEDAKKIYHSLVNNGHLVFFDRSSIPVSAEYNTAIYSAIQSSDIMIFLISPESVTPGHYTISELRFAEDKWPVATDKLVPVMVVKTPMENIPAYVQSVSILQPDGNLTAELTIEIERLYAKIKSQS